MMHYSIGRIFKFSLQNFWRNFWLSIATVTVLVLTLLTINILIVLNVIGQTAISTIEQKIDVSVYFVSEAEEEVVKGAQEYLLSLDQVRDVQHISAEEGLQRFKDSHADDPEVLAALDEVDGNPIGDTLIVTARQTEDFPFILEALNNPQFRDQIRDQDFKNYEAIIDRINSMTVRARVFGLALSAIFVLISILIVFNTIKVAIYIHREEIAIMKLVGASNSFVRSPFLLEALIYSVLAVVITAAIVLPLVGVLEPQIQSFFETTDISLTGFYRDGFLQIFGLQLLGLAILGIGVTGLAMNRYLKV